MLRAKFVCQSVAPQYASPDPVTGEKKQFGEALKLVPVCPPVGQPDHPNRSWWDATPSGELTMWINNPAAFGKLEGGKEYFIDITPAVD